MGRSVLLCDDEAYILRAAEIKFKKAGYEVRCASDGQEAWEAIQEKLPDLLVTDYQMPRLDGLGLVRRIREHAETRHLPVIMLSAKGFELSYEDVQRELAIRVLMPKPFSPRELEACAREILDGQQQEV